MVQVLMPTFLFFPIFPSKQPVVQIVTSFYPNDFTFVSHVMDFVKNNPGDFSHDF